MTNTTPETLFEAVVENPDTQGGLSETAARAEPANFWRHVVSLTLSKLADGLMDPKLVLSWLLTHLGAGAGWSGLLVPVREAGALLPQLFTADPIHRMAQRKWAWAIGAGVQGTSVGLIAVAALTLSGGRAGAVIVGLLAVLAVARSVCSVSYKDVLGKTVGTTRRGTATGIASSVSAAGVIIFAAILLLALAPLYILVIGALGLASLAWLAAGALFSTLVETSERGQSKSGAGLEQLALLRERPQLARFIVARAALVGTALAPPYLVMLTGNDSDGGGLDRLGLLVLASSFASLLSSFVWGRLSDRSSRRVLIYSGLAGAVALGGAIGVEVIGVAQNTWAMPVVLFVLMIAYQGVRQGRSTHLVDMASKDDRAAYTAVSNTVVGLVIIGGGALIAALATVSIPLVIGVMGVFCLLGAYAAYGLNEEQK